MDLATAKQTVFDLLAAYPDGTPDATLEHVVRVYKGEPRAGALMLPVSVTVATDSMDAETIGLTVRVYAKPDTDAQGVQDWLDITVEQVERLIDDQTDGTQFTRGSWSIAYAPDIDSFVASCPMTCSRTDF